MDAPTLAVDQTPGLGSGGGDTRQVTAAVTGSMSTMVTIPLSSGSSSDPAPIAAARRLRGSVEKYGHFRHTAKQKPFQAEALSLLDAHTAALEATDPPAMVISGLPSPMTPALPWSGPLSDTASADEHRGMLDSTVPHA